MVESIDARLADSSLKTAMLEAVVAEDLDQIPTDFDDVARFVICSVRSAARRLGGNGVTLFILSESPVTDGKSKGFARVMHMQDGHGDIEGGIVLTSRDANNGYICACGSASIECIVDKAEAFGFGALPAVFWDASVRVATVYPKGIECEAAHLRFSVPCSDRELTQDDVCEVLDLAYRDNLKNPSGHTIRLWDGGKLSSTAEEEIERHLKGQLALFFAGRARPIRVLSQTNTSAGRTDLILLQKTSTGEQRLSGVVELKVLRGPIRRDREVTAEGLSQGYHYRRELELPFSTLALYDVTEHPTDDTAPLVAGQEERYLAEVRVRRFPLYGSPKAWRDAAASCAA